MSLIFIKYYQLNLKKKKKSIYFIIQNIFDEYSFLKSTKNRKSKTRSGTSIDKLIVDFISFFFFNFLLNLGIDLKYVFNHILQLINNSLN